MEHEQSGREAGDTASLSPAPGMGVRAHVGACASHFPISFGRARVGVGPRTQRGTPTRTGRTKRTGRGDDFAYSLCASRVCIPDCTRSARRSSVRWKHARAPPPDGAGAPTFMGLGSSPRLTAGPIRQIRPFSTSVSAYNTAGPTAPAPRLVAHTQSPHRARHHPKSGLRRCFACTVVGG